MDEKLISRIEDLGFKEYKPGAHESYDRAWQLKLTEDSFINVNWYDFDREGLAHMHKFMNLPEIVVYTDNGKFAKQDHYYAFRSAKDIFRKIEQIIDGYTQVQQKA